jgi:hypothetical protein
MFIETPDLIQALEQDGTGIHANVFKRVNAAYPYGGHCHINRFYCSLLASPSDSDSINSMA